jgi:hypothetical protein
VPYGWGAARSAGQVHAFFFGGEDEVSEAEAPKYEDGE